MNFSERADKLRMKIQLAQYQLDSLLDREKDEVSKDRTVDQISKWNIKKDILKKKIQVFQSRLSRVLDDESRQKSREYQSKVIDNNRISRNKKKNDYDYITKRQKYQKGVL